MSSRFDGLIRGAALAGAAGGTTTAIRAIRRRLGARIPTRRVMSSPAVTIDAGATVSDAARLFAETGVGALPVCNGDGQPVAVVTDRDLVVRVLGQDGEDVGRSVSEVAEPQPVVAHAYAPVAKTAATMRRHGLRRLPVVEGERVVGVIAREDIIGHVSARAADGLQRIDGRASDRRSGRWLFERAYA